MGNFIWLMQKTKHIFTVKDEKILMSHENSDYIINLTPGLKILLFQFEPNQKFNKDIITKEDVEQYLRIYGQKKIDLGKSNRGVKIFKLYPEIEQQYFLKGGTGLQLLKVVIPNSIEKIKDRIKVLHASKSHGQKNVLSELTALLDHLLEKKQITKKQYLQILE